MRESGTEKSSCIDVGRIAELMAHEWLRFCRNYHEQVISEQQDLRGLVIEWFALHLPEAFSDRLIADMESHLHGWHDAPSYRTFGWYRCAPIDAALLALKDDCTWIRAPLANIDHHNSSLRTMVLESIALIVHRLSFYEEDLQERTAHNIRSLQGWWEWCVAFCVVACGPREAKKQLFEKWISEYRDPEYSSVRQILGDLADGRLVANPCLSLLLETQQRVTLWLMREPYPSAQQSEFLELSPAEAEQQDFGWRLQALDDTLLWQGMRKHPLVSPTLSLEP